MLTALDAFAIEKIINIINEIYKSGDILEGLIRCIFIALIKKLSANECNVHGTIYLISRWTKLIRIIIIPARSRIKMENYKNSVFLKETETKTSKFMLRKMYIYLISIIKSVS